MEFYDNHPIRIGDLVEVARDARSGIDGKKAVVKRMDNLTATASVCPMNKAGYESHGRFNVHVSKLTIVGRTNIQQLAMELK